MNYHNYVVPEEGFGILPYDVKKKLVPAPRGNLYGRLGEVGVGGSLLKGMGIMVVGGAGLLLLLNWMNKRTRRA